MTEVTATAARGEDPGTLRAAQAALAAEHAAVYGYGVLGGRLEGRPRTDATAPTTRTARAGTRWRVRSATWAVRPWRRTPRTLCRSRCPTRRPPCGSPP